MISEKLIIHNEDGVHVEVFMNTKCEILLLDITDKEDECPFAVAINRDDWKELKAFIDKQFCIE